jgi:hypothetical protein
MATKIIHKKSSVAEKVPLASDLEVGELAINLADKLIYTKNAAGEVIVIGGGVWANGDVGFEVKNQTGSTIPKGTLVGFVGTVGASGRLLVAPFLADGSQPSEYVVGLTTTDLVNGADGLAIDHGKISGLNTSAWAQGTILYASSTVAGGLTSTQPAAPNNKITVAAVVNSSSTVGTLEIRLTVGSSLKNDELVQLTSLSNGQTLVYNSTTGRFENKAAPDAVVYTAGDGLTEIAGEFAVDSSVVRTSDSRLTNAREWTASTVSQIEAETGTATTRRAFTAQRVRQAILGWWSGSSDKAKLDGIEAGAQVNVATNLGYTTAASTGTVTSSTGSNTTIPAATTSLAGLLTSTDKTKLDGVATGATANTGTVTSVAASAGTGISVSGSPITTSGTLTITNTAPHQATNLGITGTGDTRTVTSSTGTNVTIPVATTTTAGWLSISDKSKLDGVEAGAQANVATNLGNTVNATSVTVTSSTGSNTTVAAATTTNAGVFAAADKTKLDGIAAGAQVNVATNLSYTSAASTGTVNSSTGTNATIPAATTSIAGLLTSTDKTKLDGIATGATANNGTVTSVAASAGTGISVTGSPITSSGTLTITNTAPHIATNLSVTNGTTAGPTINSSTGTNVTFPTASATISGAVTTGAQTWAGVKTFNSTITGSISGNAGTATTLATARTINGTSFNGSANITTANWGTARTLSFTGDATGSSSVNGSDNVATALTLVNSGVTAGSYGSATLVPVLTVDAKGRVTAASTATISTGAAAQTAGSTTGGALAYNGTTRAAGQLYGGTTNPVSTTRVNYDGHLHVNNLVAVGDVNTTSDERLKTNWRGLATNFLDQLAGVKYGVYDRVDINATQAGVSAQSLQKVLPQVVSANEEGTLSVNYGNAALVAVIELTQLVKQLQEEIKQLKAE